MTSASKMERGRYTVIYYHYERVLREDELRRVFTYSLNRVYGIKGSLQMGLFLAWVHPTEKIAIIRTSHTTVNDLLCSTFFITDFFDKSLSIIPLKTTGSIKKAKTIANTNSWHDLFE